MLQVRSKRGSRSGQSLLRGVTRSHRDTGSSCCTMTTRLHCARLRCHGWGRRDVWRKVMLKTDAGRMYHLADVHVHVGQDNKKKCSCTWCFVRHETNNFCHMYFGSSKGCFFLCCKLQMCLLVHCHVPNNFLQVYPILWVGSCVRPLLQRHFEPKQHIT